ncbi:hypothetical protein, partial [Agathobacter rectalis]
QAISIGISSENEVVCHVEQHDALGIAFSINDQEHYQIPILGIHNMRNAAIAITVGKLSGLDYETIKTNIAQ